MRIEKRDMRICLLAALVGFVISCLYVATVEIPLVERLF